MHARLRALCGAVVVAACWFIGGFGLSTVESFYQGPTVVRMLPARLLAVSEVQGRVGECVRTGPLSANGFGYWWLCQVTVQTAGRSVTVALGKSMASPTDTGRTVELYEACTKNGESCSYGLRVGRGWGIAVAVLQVLHRFIGLLLFVFVLRYLLRALLGEDRFAALMSRGRA
jgi:hypothetical protein